MESKDYLRVGTLRTEIHDEIVDITDGPFNNVDAALDFVENQVYVLLDEHESETRHKNLEESYKDLIKRVNELAIGLY